MSVAAIARRILDDPSRLAETYEHYKALVTAMNGSVDAQREQDALPVLEAISLLLGQIIANGDERARSGLLIYVTERASYHAHEFLNAGKAAPHLIVPD